MVLNHPTQLDEIEKDGQLPGDVGSFVQKFGFDRLGKRQDVSIVQHYQNAVGGVEGIGEHHFWRQYLSRFPVPPDITGRVIAPDDPLCWLVKLLAGSQSLEIEWENLPEFPWREMWLVVTVNEPDRSYIARRVGELQYFQLIDIALQELLEQIRLELVMRGPENECEKIREWRHNKLEHWFNTALKRDGVYLL